MTSPTQTCHTCGRVRDCMLHQRSENPPTAAKEWLIRTCDGRTEKPLPCDIRYLAGLAFGRPMSRGLS